MDSVWCEVCARHLVKDATSFLWDAWDDAEFLEKTERDVDSLKSEIWLPFEHRAKVLHHFSYLDFPAQKVTKRGKWLADLRVDRPLAALTASLRRQPPAWR